MEKEYETANSWFSAMHAKGIKVPITLCQAIEKKMKLEKITFSEAYQSLEEKDLITVRDKEILFNSSN
jgi:DNA-binding transcriptional regulator YhcF (GntR family)